MYRLPLSRYFSEFFSSSEERTNVRIPNTTTRTHVRLRATADRPNRCTHERMYSRTTVRLNPDKVGRHWRTSVRSVAGTPTPEGGHPVAAPSIVSIDFQCVMFFKPCVPHVTGLGGGETALVLGRTVSVYSSDDPSQGSSHSRGGCRTRELFVLLV